MARPFSRTQSSVTRALGRSPQNCSSKGAGSVLEEDSALSSGGTRGVLITASTMATMPVRIPILSHKRSAADSCARRARPCAG